jgi:Ulp1 family protease
MIKPLRNQQPFHRLVCSCSWELECFNTNVPADGNALEKVMDQYSKGVFLSSVEKDTMSWGYHLGNKDFHRVLFHRGSIKNSDFTRLTPGRWLNDEVINGYIGLLGKIKLADTLVLSGWFWASVTACAKTDQNAVKAIRSMVSTCISNFSKL